MAAQRNLMWHVAFTGRLQGEGAAFSVSKAVLTTKGSDAFVNNTCVVSENGDRHVTCDIFIHKESLCMALMPCVQFHHTTPISDMYALPTWLQLSCKPHQLLLPEMENPWDLIPVMLTICTRIAMVSVLQSDMHDAAFRHSMRMLTDMFDHKYSRYGRDTPMAVDELLNQIGPDCSAVGHCMAIGGYVIVNFFAPGAYAPGDTWQSAVNQTNKLPFGLVFKSNMSDVRCKITAWMRGVENELRLKGPHYSTIQGHAKSVLRDTLRVFDGYDTIRVIHSDAQNREHVDAEH